MNMKLKIFFFVFIFTISMSCGYATGGSRFSVGGLRSNFGSFNRNLSPLSDLAVKNPLNRLNDRVDAGINRVKYHSRFGSPGYRVYRRSRAHSLYLKSPGHYFRYGYKRHFYRNKPYGYYYNDRPYGHYYKQKYFGYYLPPEGFYLGFYGLKSCGYNLGLLWYRR